MKPRAAHKPGKHFTSDYTQGPSENLFSCTDFSPFLLSDDGVEGVGDGRPCCLPSNGKMRLAEFS